MNRVLGEIERRVTCSHTETVKNFNFTAITYTSETGSLRVVARYEMLGKKNTTNEFSLSVDGLLPNGTSVLCNYPMCTVISTTDGTSSAFSLDPVQGLLLPEETVASDDTIDSVRYEIQNRQYIYNPDAVLAEDMAVPDMKGMSEEDIKRLILSLGFVKRAQQAVAEPEKPAKQGIGLQEPGKPIPQGTPCAAVLGILLGMFYASQCSSGVEGAARQERPAPISV